MSVRAISNLERGRTTSPHRRSLRRLADALALGGQARDQFFAAAGWPSSDGRPIPAIAVASRLDRADGAPVIPRQLPGPARVFVGRERELTILNDLSGEAGIQPAAVVISAIEGTAGVGKSALAVRWAYQVATEFPDGQLYVNLRGYDPGEPVSPADALAGFLRALGVPGKEIPADLGERAAQFRSILAGRRVLLVLDNAADVGQVRVLLPGNPGCVTVVTSRDRLTGLVAREGAVRLDLDLLPLADAVGLLKQLIGGRVNAEPDAAAALAELCARLPLALRVAAELAATRPATSLAGLVGELADQRRLDLLDADGDPHTGVRAVFSWSYQHLDTRAARLFRLLGLLPGPDISASAAASLAGAPPAAVRRGLSELVRAHLITEPTPGRFALHDLLRAYAAEKARSADGEQSRRAATRRVLDYYLHSAHAADKLLNPARDQITMLPCADVQPVRFSEYGQAMAWFQAEHAVLLTITALAVDAGYDAHAWQLPWTMVDFLEFSGHWEDWMNTQRIAVAAARRLGDRAAEARCGRALGYAYARNGRDNDALGQLRQALRLFGETEDPIGQARTHQDLSWLLDHQGRVAEALCQDQIALRLYEQAGHVRGQANALNAIGWLHAMLGNHAEAVDHCRQALVLHQQFGNRRGEAAALDSLGYACHHLGQHSEAVTCYQRSLGLFRELNDRSNEAEILIHLGDAHQSAGHRGHARDSWRQALDILDDLGHPDADQLRDKLRMADRAIEPRGAVIEAPRG